MALPITQAISYSTLNFEKIYGPQFHFADSILKKQKTIIVHIDEVSCDKLLMVMKQDYDDKSQGEFCHIEIETLPFVKMDERRTHIITTFLHGMYYPANDCFTHIDYTKNQYAFDDYVKKYSESTNGIPIDFYTEKELHYKIQCVENGSYSREGWYNLMISSLSVKYRKLLDEILGQNVLYSDCYINIFEGVPMPQFVAICMQNTLQTSCGESYGIEMAKIMEQD